MNNVPGLFGLLVEANLPVFLLDPSELGDIWGNITARTPGKTYYGINAHSKEFVGLIGKQKSCLPLGSYGPSFGYTGTPRLGDLAVGMGTIDLATLPTNGGAVSLSSRNINSFKYFASWAILENAGDAGSSDRPYLWVRHTILISLHPKTCV